MRLRRLRSLGVETGMSRRGDAENREGSGAARVVGKASGNKKGVESWKRKKGERVMKAKVVDLRVACF